MWKELASAPRSQLSGRHRYAAVRALLTATGYSERQESLLVWSPPQVHGLTLTQHLDKWESQPVPQFPPWERRGGCESDRQQVTGLLTNHRVKAGSSEVSERRHLLPAQTAFPSSSAAQGPCHVALRPQTLSLGLPAQVFPCLLHLSPESVDPVGQSTFTSPECFKVMDRPGGGAHSCGAHSPRVLSYGVCL